MADTASGEGELHDKKKVTTNKKQYADTDGPKLIDGYSDFCTYFNVQSLAVV